jgi:CubicO group peptidase (beta-lactamase class C family)
VTNLGCYRFLATYNEGGEAMKRALLVTSACFLLGSAALAGELTTASPSEVGMSRLERITQFFKADTDSKRLPGAVVMIARHGRVAYYEAFGVRDPATGAPMRKDSIFRIYSMTKPITGVAVLMLMEEGKLRLSDPISKYLPALKDPKVMVETVDAQGHRTTSTVPANRDITIQDLLRHTSGISYGIGNSAAEQAMRDAGLGAQPPVAGKEPLSTRITDQQLVEELGKLPLMFQPGTSWEYGRSIDVLLALVEKVSGQRADQFFQERIFQPLGMTDTFFNVPPDKLDRVAQPGPDPDTHETAKLTDVTKTRTFLGGGEGLLSTASDYMRFALMLANGGELDGTRLLSRKTVELMASDHLGPALSQGPRFAPGPGYGFGLTVAVRMQPGMAPYPGSVGEYNWGGAAGTAFWVDPKEQLVPIMLIQAPGQRLYYRFAFRDLVYQTITDRPELDQGVR